MNESDILKKSARSVLGVPEQGELRILLFLAIEGPLNQKELGIRTSKRRAYTGFDRWGVKNRLEGSSKFPGLINYDYVEKVSINKKEIKYRLTLKGFLACLGYLELDQIYLIKKYNELLREYINNKKIKLILNSIKYESKYLLFSFYLQGINLLSSRYLLKFISEFHFKSEEENFPFTGIFRDHHTKEDFDLYEKVFHDCITSYKHAQETYSYVLPKTAFNEYIKKLKKKKFNSKIRESIALFLYHKYWTRYLPSLSQVDDRQLVGTYLFWQQFSVQKALSQLSNDERKLYMKNKFDATF